MPQQDKWQAGWLSLGDRARTIVNVGDNPTVDIYSQRATCYLLPQWEDTVVMVVELLKVQVDRGSKGEPAIHAALKPPLFVIQMDREYNIPGRMSLSIAV